MQPTAASTCVKCGRPLGDALFCQFDGTYVLDPEGTVVMAPRGERILAWFVNILIILLSIITLGLLWIIWWFIVAPKGQNPGKAIVGLRVIRANGNAVKTGGMFVRGMVGQLFGLIFVVQVIDDLWMFFDKNAQTLHDKAVETVVVKAKGSEKIVEAGALPNALAPPASYAPYAPALSIPSASAPAGVAEQPARATDEVFCRNCGRPVKADAQFCPNCGASLAG
jgi:uncharacterized RDD family membrane protein YckC